MQIIQDLPELSQELYSLSKGGKVKQWRISVVSDEEESTIITTYGYVDGKQQTSEKRVREGKNIGKSNETTHQEQAIAEALSEFQKKLDKGYVTDPSGISGIKLPMLAHEYTKHGHKIAFPCYAQPKLNGIRCIAHRISEDDVKLYSRTGKEFTTINHIVEELIRDNLLPIGGYLDGELYNHDYTLQDIVSLVKSPKQDKDRSCIQYHVYDLPDTDMTFAERYAKLQEVFLNVPEDSCIKLVSTAHCDHQDVNYLHEDCVTNGYEGLMLRNSEGKYLFNHRSADLQKLKTFQTEEFVITDVVEGTGKDEGAAIFICMTNEGKDFHVRPEGNYERRRAWFENKDSLIGKLLTVKFFHYTPDGKPFWPVGLIIRDYE